MIFPKVTYNWDEFCDFNCGNEYLRDFTGEKYLGWYSEYDGGYIWLAKPSIVTLLHEFLHHVGFQLHFNKAWHSLIEKLL